MKTRFLLVSALLLGLLLLPDRPLLAQAPPSGFQSTLVSGGWDEAVGLTFNATGSQMYVWERPGRVWVVEGGQRRVLLDLREEVGGWHDHGLLGFALHPQFATNGYIYLFYLVDRHHLLNFGTAAYNPATNDYYSATIGRITRYQVSSPGANPSLLPGSRTVLLGSTRSTGVPSLFRSHVTGSLVFGADGTLLVSTGDGASPDPDYGSRADTYFAQALADGIIRPQEDVGGFRSQLLNCLNGKILRLDPLTGAGVPSNPYYDAANPNAPRSKVWALGLRNPFRMSLRPGTGSADPAAANPGVLYVGDVGWATWEEVSVVDRPRQNLGWPLYEGLTAHGQYINQLTANQDAPNPLSGAGGCSQPYFNFRDLVTQATPSGTAAFPNPCNPAQTVPAGIPTFVQTRPLLDWKHDPAGPARTGTFSGGAAATANIGAAGAPVSGPQFGGSAAVGGVFYPYSDFPAGYQNSYFFGDYGSSWIRNLSVSGANQPLAVRDFVSAGAVVVSMAVSPAETGLYYVNFYPSEIRKVTYVGATNAPPVARAAASLTYGPSPLPVQLTGSASTDPEGQALSYAWDFGDGTTSTLASPAHTFVAPTAAPTPFAVKLTVRDSQGASSSPATLLVSVNNTPPQVAITSPLDNALYSLAGPTNYPLRATVTDAEHSGSQLRYAWQTTLHHNTHIHPEPVDAAPETTARLDPLGCGAETYYYTVELTVTDAGGLSTRREARLNPDCGTAPAYTFYRAVNLNGPALTLDGNAWAGTATGAANFSTNGIAFVNPNVALLPATDAARTAMIRSSVYRPGSLSATFAAVPAGSYQVFVHVWEDNDPEVFSLSLNGHTVLSSYNSGPAGTWARLGPYPLTLAAAGPVELSSTGGAANFSGIELWQIGASPPPANQAPTANAGPDQALTLPTASATLGGAGTDADGTIAAYAWAQVSGPATATLSSPASATTAVSGLTAAGTYVFRLVVTDDDGAASAPDLVSIVVSLAPPAGSSFAFYRAVNLNGPALTLDGNAWAGTATGAADFSTTGFPFEAETVPLLPATDAPRAAMIRRAVYRGSGLSATFGAVPAGSYQVFVYVWEDNDPEVFSLSLNGQLVRGSYNSGTAGTWARLGPYPLTLATPGPVQLSAAGGAANFSGLELWRQTAGPVAFRQVLAAAPAVPTEASAGTARAYPNPSRDGRFRLQLPAAAPQGVPYTLLSAVGTRVASGRLGPTRAAAVVELDFAAQMPAAGLYILRLEGRDRTVYVRLLRE